MNCRACVTWLANTALRIGAHQANITEAVHKLQAEPDPTSVTAKRCWNAIALNDASQRKEAQALGEYVWQQAHGIDPCPHQIKAPTS